jgi:hypothetical protein
MTEMPRKRSKKFSIRKYLRAEYGDQIRHAQAERIELERLKLEFDRRAEAASDRIDRSLNMIGSSIVTLQSGILDQNDYVFSLFDVIGEAIERVERGKTGQEKMDELVGVAEKAKKDIDRHLAKRLTELFTSKGHEAMYGTGKRT